MNYFVFSLVTFYFVGYALSVLTLLAPTKHQRNGGEHEESHDFELLNHPEIRLTGSHSPFRLVLLKLYLIIDSSLYLKWLKKTHNSDKAKHDITKHYERLVGEVQQKFQAIRSSKYRFDVVLADISIDENHTLPIEDSNNVKAAAESVVDYEQVLDEVRQKMVQKKEILPKFNAVLVFTASTDKSGQIGKSNAGSICTPNALAILREDENMSITIRKASALIGEILGAKSLGDCYDVDSSQHVPGESSGFSSCSVKQFEDLIDSFNKWLRRDCLLDINNYSRSKREEEEYDEEYTPDNMCQYYLGERSYYCPPGTKANEKVCHELVCYAPNNNTCFKVISSYTHDGFLCGSKKWCVGGYCVYSKKAPSVENEQCMYGDYPHYLKFNNTMLKCKQLLKRKGYCYYSYFTEYCCGTCKSFYRNNAPEDCHYGDYVANLKVDGVSVSCDFAEKHLSMCYTKAFRSVCCGTCLDLIPKLRPNCLGGDFQVEIRFIDRTVVCRDLINYKNLCQKESWFKICCGTCSDILEGKL